MEKIIDPAICGWDTASYYLFSSNVFGDLIYYSHVFPAIAAILLGFFIFLSNRNDPTTRLLFAITLTFASWSFIDLLLWATERTDLIMFFWSILIYFELLIYILSFYFVYSLLYKTLPEWKIDIVTLVLFGPLILFGHTNLNLIGFDFTNCEREALEGPLWQYYIYNVEILISVTIAILGIIATYKAKVKEKIAHITLIGGVEIFLLMFSLGNISGSFGFDWNLAQYGLFGMVALIAIIGYLLVNSNSFKITVLTSQVLVTALSILVFSLLLVPKIENVRVIAGITLIIVLGMGLVLIRSNKRDLKQKEQIEQLASGLEQANDQLKVLDKMKSEFVSIASHQLRSPLTAVRGYSSMILEGSFGPVPDKARDAIERIAEASRLMASSVEDYLNVSRIQAGNMKYEYSDFNLKDLASRVADDTRQIAIKKGLLLTFKTSLTKTGIVHADIGKTRQIIDNLVNNSLKYTPKGSIEVLVRDEPKSNKIFVEIKDTGIGMSAKTIENMFGKFERASNANEVNVTGTGLGLYIARKMAREMGGDVSAHSEGEGKGSLFRIELPLMM